MKTAVAVSGGIDSLYALIKLQEQGHDVFALHARFIETEYDVVPQLREACEILNIPFHCIDLKKHSIRKSYPLFLITIKMPERQTPALSAIKA